MNIFAVTRIRGRAWNQAESLEGQLDWHNHSQFMNGLLKDGFILLGGPLEGAAEVLLIVRAHSPEEIRQRFAADCWTALNLLEISRIVPWTLRLGSLP